MNLPADIAAKFVAQLKWLDDKDVEMLGLVERLCNVNSGTFNLNGLAIVREMLVQEFQSLHAKLRDVAIETMETVNDQGEKVESRLGQAIHFVRRPEIRPQILLCIHMDTVYAVNDAFQKCVRLDKNLMNGPGVIDAKGGLVVMLYALKALEASPWASKIGWQVLINADEEIGSPGTGSAIRKLSSTADCGLLFEPSLPNGELVSWRKGSGNFTFVVRGRSAHAGRAFLQGRNAVAAMCRLMVAIEELNTDPEVTFNVGRVSGGGALNIVPDLAVGRINVRVRTYEQQRAVEQSLQSLLDKFNESLDGIRIEMHGSFTSPPKPLNPETEAIMQRIETCGAFLGQSIKWEGSGGASDGNKFAAAGLMNIDSLGPAGGEIHSAREFLFIDSLVPKAKLTAMIMMSFAAEKG